ncbi:MAG TPA: sigma-70 family RNA polymerase sigma factor [Pirellulaceae bacterium]|mgnify:CR=1 FL=1|nr:sigma-70 family RNA polymerase sigma factor [Pirellulaceae bacterium]HMO93771.1 sigma-70 family RNA polymerase sigma factor [Pirellulaceae bacterium]HMP71339.1 sigma-70 family RNA polymerase sigma factor [Pirellulaceae bacterium]
MFESPQNPTTDSVQLVVLANHRHFLGFLKTRLRNHEDAEDILQDALVKGLEKAGEIRDEEKIISWFYRLLRNAITDHYRQVAASQRALSKFSLQAHEAISAIENERTICDCFNKLVPLLRTEYSDMIRRVDLDGEAMVSVANGLDVSQGNARVRLHRARTALRNELKQFCGKCADAGCLDCTCSRREEAAPK